MPHHQFMLQPESENRPRDPRFDPRCAACDSGLPHTQRFHQDSLELFDRLD